MSPLWRDEVGIYLAQRRACLVRMRRGVRPTLAAEVDHADPAAAAGWEGALALLEQQLNEGTWSDACVRVVLADVVKPGDKFQIAVFGVNGPISVAPMNFVWFREAKIEFFH